MVIHTSNQGGPGFVSSFHFALSGLGEKVKTKQYFSVERKRKELDNCPRKEGWREENTQAGQRAQEPVSRNVSRRNRAGSWGTYISQIVHVKRAKTHIIWSICLVCCEFQI